MGNKKYPVIFIIILCSVLYANTLFNGFALDDKAVITENYLSQKGFGGIRDLVTHDYFYGCHHAVTGLYRPIPLLTHAVEYQFFGENALAGHLVNIALYMIVCVALFYLFTHMFPGSNYILPLLAVSLFAVLPLHTETVANIKGRDDLLNLLFLLLSLIFFIIYTRRSSLLHFFAALFFFFLALLSKEPAVTFLAVIPLTLWFFCDAKYKKLFFVFSGMTIVTAIYLVLRFHFLDSSSAYRIFDGYHQYCDSRADRLATSTSSLLDYLKLLIYPSPLVYDYSYNQIPVVSWENFKTIISVVVTLALISYALFTFRRKNLLSYCIITYYLTLSVSANIIIPVSGVFAERFLFVPSLAFSLAAAWLILKIFKASLKQNFSIGNLPFSLPYVFLFTVGLILCVFSTLTIHRNTCWKNDFTLFSSDLKHQQNNALANFNMGALYTNWIHANAPVSDTFYTLKAIRCYRRATDIDPMFSKAYFFEGALYYNMHKYNEAIASFNKAAKTSSEETPEKYSAAMASKNAGKAWFSLGLESFTRSDFRVSIYDFQQAIAMDSTNFSAIQNIGACYFNLKKPDSASVFYSRYVEKMPGDAEAWHDLGLSFLAWKQENEAVKCFRKAVSLDPKRREKYRTMGMNI